MKLYLSIILLLSTLNVLSQNSLKFRIIDCGSGNPLENVTLLLENEKIHYSSITNSDGEVSFAHTNEMTYRLMISHIGFVKTDTIVYLNKKNDIINICLYPVESEIDAITVIGKKKSIVMKRGSIVVDVERSPLMNSGNIWETLKITPSVQATETGLLSVKGKATTVYIDGRRIYMAGSDLMEYLKSIPAENVKSVEVISNPSALYPSDITTVIDIKSKKLEQNGLKGSVSNSLTKAKFVRNASAVRTDLKKSNLEAQVGVIRDQNKTQMLSDIETEQLIGFNWKVAQKHIQSNVNNKIFGNVNIRNSKKSYFNIYTELNLTNGNTDINSNNGHPYNNRLAAGDSIFIFDSKGNTGSQTLFLQTAYNLSLDSIRGSFHIQFEYLDNDRSTHNTRRLESFTSHNLTDKNIYLDTLPNKIKTYVATVHYTKNLFGGNITTGGRLLYNSLTSNSQTNHYQLNNNPENRPPNLTKAIFLYDESIYTFFSEWDKEINKLYFRVGLKFENNNIQSQEMVMQNRSRVDWFNVLPSFLMQWSKNEDNIWNLSYNTTFTRPDYFQLNPFQRLTDNSAVNLRGNQGIKPQLNHSIELSWTDNNYLASSSGIQYYKNFISTIYLRDETGLVYQQYDNFNALQFYFNINANYHIADWWQLLGSSNLSYISAKYDKLRKGESLPIWDYRITSAITLKKSWIFQLSHYYTNTSSDGFFKNYAYSNGSVAIQKKITKPKITVTCTVNDIFRKEFDRNRTIYDGMAYYSSQYNDTRLFRLSVLWNFGKHNIKVETKSQSESDETLKRSNK